MILTSSALSTPFVELRPYQVAAVEALRAGARRGLRRMLVEMATGLGKTVLFAHLAHRVVSRGQRVLVSLSIMMGGRRLCLDCAASWYEDEDPDEPSAPR